ncbi:MAG: SDR family NAD(P)-dependent oxidoreductase [Rhizobiaceae bacterium]
MTTSRVALVTGGASGIGRESALHFAAAGHRVVVADRDEAALSAVSAELTELGADHLVRPCDVTSEESVAALHEAIAEAYGRLDILVTAAGVDLHRSMADTAVADWRRVIDINLTGGFLCAKHAQALMRSNGFGRIVFLGSTSGVTGMGYPAYSASKAALAGFARSAARELAPYGITVNVVAPGPVKTPMTEKLWQEDPDRLDNLKRAVPVGRVAEASEIAELIAFISSDAAGFVTGSQIVADGGLTSTLNLSPGKWTGAR